MPRALGAGLVVLGLLAALGSVVYLVAEPAGDWIDKAPSSLHRLEGQLRDFKEPMERVNRATREVEKLTDVDGEGAGPVEVDRRNLSGTLLQHTGRVVAGGAVVLVLLYFLLASGDLFLRKVIRVLPTLAYFALTAAEGYFLTPLILGRRLTLNPVMILLSLLLWGWLWGAVGAVLAVPLLASFKIVCDRVRPLKPLGELLEG